MSVTTRLPLTAFNRLNSEYYRYQICRYICILHANTANGDAYCTTSYSAADSDAKQLYTLHTVVHSTCCDGIYCVLEGHLNK